VNLFDLIFLALAVAGGVGGYRLGFVTRVVSWVAMLVGLFVAVRILPWLLGFVPPQSNGWALIIAVSVVLALTLGAQGIGLAAGNRIRPLRKDGTVAVADRILGAVAGVVGVVLIVWLILPLLVQTPGWVSRQTTNSAVAQTIDDHLPRPPDTVLALRSFVGEQFPQVFDAMRPTPELGPPPESSGVSAAVAQQVARSVVKVEGEACNRIQDGTGFVVAEGLVVTNAHVVAGESETQLERDDGTRVPAQVVLFDPDRDLALLRAPRLDRPALPVTGSAVGDSGGVFGHPGGAPLRVAPFQTARQLNATGRDIYGQALTMRRVLELRASLRPGDSGSALVNPGGEVVGVAFAIAPDQPDVAYALDTSELSAVLARPRSGAVDTGPCIR